MTMHTLLVEDNVSLAQTVIAYFDLEGIDCDYASTGSQGLELALSNDYQAILLDMCAQTFRSPTARKMNRKHLFE